MVELEEKNDIHPICPFCNIEINKVFYQQILGFLGKRYLYFCSACKKILGVSHRKGFFMG